MEEPEIPSLTSFNQGEDDSGNQWAVGTFTRNGTELKARNYEQGYSTLWDTNQEVEDIVRAFSKFYHVKGSVAVDRVPDDGDYTHEEHRLTSGDGNIDDYNFGEDVIGVDLQARDFGIVWRPYGDALIEDDYSLPYNVTVYVNDPKADVTEPFLEPTILVMPETGGPRADKETVNELSEDAERFLNETDPIFEEDN